MKQGYDEKLVDEQQVTTYCKKKIENNKIQNTAHQNLHELFQEHAITVFKRNKNLKEITTSIYIKNDKVKKFNIPSRTGKCAACLLRARTLCCNQLKTTNTFTS